MPVWWVHLFICDKCGKQVSVSDEAVLYDDPVIVPPSGWGYPKAEPNDLCCDTCMAELAG